MISKTANLKLVDEIAALYCGTNNLCVANTVSRLKTNLNDFAFEKFINYLNTGRTYFAIESGFKAGGNNTSSMQISYEDIISGEKGSGWIQSIPNDEIFSNPRNWTAILSRSNLIYLASFNIGANSFLLINNPNLANYDLSHVSGEPITKLPVNTPIINEPVKQSASTNNLSPLDVNFNYNTLLFPAILIIGLYFLVKK